LKNQNQWSWYLPSKLVSCAMNTLHYLKFRIAINWPTIKKKFIFRQVDNDPTIKSYKTLLSNGNSFFQTKATADANKRF